MAQPSLQLDLSSIAATWHTDAAGAKAILEEFRRAIDKDAAGLRESVAHEDFGLIGRFTHRMLGASRMVGAHDLADACESLNDASRALDMKTIAHAMHALEGELLRLNGYFNQGQP